jgi:hypothetical protein
MCTAPREHVNLSTGVFVHVWLCVMWWHVLVCSWRKWLFDHIAIVNLSTTNADPCWFFDWNVDACVCVFVWHNWLFEIIIIVHLSTSNIDLVYVCLPMIALGMTILRLEKNGSVRAIWFWWHQHRRLKFTSSSQQCQYAACTWTCFKHNVVNDQWMC